MERGLIFLFRCEVMGRIGFKSWLTKSTNYSFFSVFDFFFLDSKSGVAELSMTRSR